MKKEVLTNCKLKYNGVKQMIESWNDNDVTVL